MSADATLEQTATPPTCPTCGSVRVVRRSYGFPGAEMWEQARTGSIRLGGCVIGAMDTWEERWHCWACADQEWLASHEAREHREGRTAHDCSDDGLLWDPDSDQNGVRLGLQDVSDRFRPPGFIDRLWPYLRDVPDGAPAWRPNVERIAAALATGRAEQVGADPYRITEEEILTLGPVRPREQDRIHTRLDRIAGALAEIPTDVELHTLDTVTYEQLVGMWSHAQVVVAMLRRMVDIEGPAAELVAARRRPALLAERHPLVDKALGIPEDRQVRRPWWRTLTADRDLVARLERLRTELDAPEVPLLRLAWLSVLTREQDAADAGGPSPSVDLPEPRWFRCPLTSLERLSKGADVKVTRIGLDAPGSSTVLDKEEDGPDPVVAADGTLTPFWSWVEGHTDLESLPGRERRRAKAWVRAGHSIALNGVSNEPFRSGGTPRWTFHARLAQLVGETDDGLPGWRPPAERLHAHLFGERDSLLRTRNWSRGYDDRIVPSLGAHHYGEIEPGVPLDYGEDHYGAFVEEMIETRLRTAVDADGFVVDIPAGRLEEVYYQTEVSDLMTEIPWGVALGDLDADGYHAHLSRGSAAFALVDRLMVAGFDEATGWAIGALVRPHLVPSPDRIVSTLLGLRVDEDSRPFWWWVLRNDARLGERLIELRSELRIKSDRREALSVLRLAEILVLQRESDRRAAIALETTLFPFEALISGGDADA